jgi:hypothetical protein
MLPTIRRAGAVQSNNLPSQQHGNPMILLNVVKVWGLHLVCQKFFILLAGIIVITPLHVRICRLLLDIWHQPLSMFASRSTPRNPVKQRSEAKAVIMSYVQGHAQYILVQL